MKILEYNGISGLSRLISWWTRGRASHTSIATDDLSHEWQAWHKGGSRWWHGKVDRYDRIGALHTPGTRVSVYDWPLTKEQEHRCIQYLESQRGKHYDWKGIFGFINLKDEDDPDALFCSEYAMRAGIECGDPLLNAEPYKVAPSYLTWSTKLTYLWDIYITKDGFERA